MGIKGYLPSESGPVPVAVKVQRPGIRTVVERDATLLRSVAIWIESLPSLTGGRLIATELVDAVEEVSNPVCKLFVCSTLDMRDMACSIHFLVLLEFFETRILFPDTVF